MWKYILSNKQTLGFSFRRERPILNYIVDFVCLELMLVIEVDGITHEIDSVAKKDIIRDIQLEEIGFKVMRFSSWEVLNRIADVSEVINEWIIKQQKH